MGVRGLFGRPLNVDWAFELDWAAAWERPRFRKDPRELGTEARLVDGALRLRDEALLTSR
jgi:hypothetical protein